MRGMTRRALFAVTAAVVMSAAAPALAAKPQSVPPSGSTCGQFYGSVVASEARQGHLGQEQNPGTLHQGFAGAEAFPHFSCS